MKANVEYHSAIVLAGWDKFIELIGPNAGEVALDGRSLNVETVVAIAR